MSEEQNNEPMQAMEGEEMAAAENMEPEAAPLIGA